MNGKSVKIKVASDKKAPSICYLIGGVDPKLLSPEQDPEQGNQEHLTFTRKETVLEAKSRIVSYINEDEFSGNVGYQYAIGVYDGKSTLTLHKSPSGIVPLTVFINSTKGTVEEHNEEIEKLSFTRKNELLASSFGSKQNQRYAANLVANSVRMDISDITERRVSAKRRREEDDYYTELPDLPPYDYTTTVPQEIYNYNAIFPKLIHNELLMKVKKFDVSNESTIESEFEKSFGKCYSFTKRCLHQVFEDDSEENRRIAIANIAYYNTLVHFHKNCGRFMRKDETQKLEKKCFLSKATMGQLLKRFTVLTDKRFSRTTTLGNLLVNTCVIVALFLNGFSLSSKEIGLMADDFNIPRQTFATQHVARVGCRSKQKQSKEDEDGNESSKKRSSSEFTRMRLVAPLLTAKKREVNVQRLLQSTNKKK